MLPVAMSLLSTVKFGLYISCRQLIKEEQKLEILKFLFEAKKCKLGYYILEILGFHSVKRSLKFH